MDRTFADFGLFLIMLDWLTLNAKFEANGDAMGNFPDGDAVLSYRNTRPHIMKVDMLTGDVEWSQPCRESVRSDSHQVTVYVGGDRVQISGSPARAMGGGDNVFGSSDIVACAKAHWRVAQEFLPFPLPPLSPVAWFPSRMDITENFDLGDHAAVRQALTYLRQVDGGRLKVDSRYAETVYWNLMSALNANKAYSKGSHLEYQLRKGQVEITGEKLALASRLLRLENKRGGEWWRRFRMTGRSWMEITEAELSKLHMSTFEKIIGSEGVEVSIMDNVLDCLQKVVDPKTGKSITSGQALAVFNTWALIKALGVENAKASMQPRRWHHHKSILFAAGFSWADFAAGNIVPFRRKAIILGEPVKSWDELKKAA